MRITCPNCGAQYEVPDEVIPNDGRDVQCSNCGMTWFQAHPDHPQDPPSAPDIYAETVTQPEPQPEPEPEPEQHEPEVAQAIEEPEPQRRELDSGVTDILRQEAEHEAELRAAEAQSGLESQPELGLEQGSAGAADRLAKMRGEASDSESSKGSRRDLLPDIDEINSSLRSEEASTALTSSLAAEDAETVKTTRKGGFSRGFALTLVLAALVVVVYVNAPEISARVPQADPFLNGLVSIIDQARTWLDEQVRAFAS